MMDKKTPKKASTPSKLPNKKKKKAILEKSRLKPRLSAYNHNKAKDECFLCSSIGVDQVQNRPGQN